MTEINNQHRRQLLACGIVQGVGFRPFVFNLAESESLKGLVSNTSAGVLIEVQGPLSAIENFCIRLTQEAPPLSRIVSLEQKDISPVFPCPQFVIELSRNTPGTNTIIPADMATCTDCLQDIRTPGNRRFGYPFTNCTNCGPRWTIIERIPYDRAFTSMAAFKMCPLCHQEYNNPRDRRFHAQPNACPQCGPKIWLQYGDDKFCNNEALEKTCHLLAQGKIVAIKGLGGFHLAVSAMNQKAVLRLRRRKHREAKPFAVMTSSIEKAGTITEISDKEKELIESSASPIVLLRKKDSTPQEQLAHSIGSNHRRLGVMLPYTPLHHLLFDQLKSYGIHTLVMTSGNKSDEPICLSNKEALEELNSIADAFLLHDREIVRRADDSVVQIISTEPHFFRRSRGFAPVPVFVKNNGPDILAVGPELKNTICLLKNDRAFLSPHIGNLENLQANNFFRETINTMTEVLECDPQIIACDLHPGYFSSQWAQQQKTAGKTVVPIQHHHAHMVAVMAEHQLESSAIGIIMDGTGYGSDGTIWGGEILVGGIQKVTRIGNFKTVALPGGDAAIKAPWRTAISYLYQCIGKKSVNNILPSSFNELPVDSILEIIDKNINCPQTSSCGRLFDAVAALCGLGLEARYDAQPAIELMALTCNKEVSKAALLTDVKLDHSLVLPAGSLVTGVARLLKAGHEPTELSARFHRTLIEVFTQAALIASAKSGLSKVILAGGVFQNELLLYGLVESLKAVGLHPYRPLQTPANDGSIALGQALIARSIVSNAPESTCGFFNS